jgi:hypothetical protein
MNYHNEADPKQYRIRYAANNITLNGMSIKWREQLTTYKDTLSKQMFLTTHETTPMNRV